MLRPVFVLFVGREPCFESVSQMNLLLGTSQNNFVILKIFFINKKPNFYVKTWLCVSGITGKTLSCNVCAKGFF